MKSKAGNRILSFALAAAMLLGGVFAAPPMTAYAVDIGTKDNIVDGGIVLGIESNTTNGNTPTIIGFGGKQWAVVGYDGVGDTLSSDTVTLLLTNGQSYGTTAFNDSASGSIYSGSNLQTAMDNAYNSLSAGEKNPSLGLVKKRTLDGGNVNFGAVGFNEDTIKGNAVTDAFFWPLSRAETKLLNMSLRHYSGGGWWLRSPGSEDIFAATVNMNGNGNIGSASLVLPYAIRPALILDLSSVIFTSAAAGGKSAATAGSELVGATAPTGAIKLTVEDTNLSFSGTPTAMNVNGRTITFSYMANGNGTSYNTLSAIVKDSGGTVEYYGKLDDGPAVSGIQGTSGVTVPDDVTASDSLLIFVEQINAANFTDYACTPVALSFTAQTAPTGLQGVACTTISNNNGQVTGITSGMEYYNGSTWVSCSTNMSDLTPGNYQFRTASSGMVIASAPVTVTVGAFTNTAPNVKTGEDTQTGSATPAAASGNPAAVPYTVDVSDWFEDADGDTLTYDIVSQDANGIVSLNSPTGALTFTPTAADASLSRTIIVKANDGTADSTINVTITINVDAVPADAITNTAPFINGQANGADTINLSLGYSDYTKNYTITGTPPLSVSIDGTNTAGASVTSGGALTISAGLGEGTYETVIKAENSEGVATMTVTVEVTDTAPQPGTHTVTVQTDGGGTAYATPTNATAGTTISLTATPNANYSFSRWDAVSPSNLNIAGDSFTMPDQAVTVKAVFEYTGSTLAPTPSSNNDSDSGSSYTPPAVTTPSTLVVDAAKAKSALSERNKSGANKARIKHNGEIKVLNEAWPVFDNVPVDFDTLDGTAVQVRVTVREPGKMTGDKLLSGYVKGSVVDSRKALFEKWFKNKVRVIHFDQQGAWGQPVEVAAKVDLTGMDTANLYFYSYDIKTNTYKRIEKPAYWIDKNGYLHFTTEYAGDIVISEGLLEKK